MVAGEKVKSYREEIFMVTINPNVLLVLIKTDQPVEKKREFSDDTSVFKHNIRSFSRCYL